MAGFAAIVDPDPQRRRRFLADAAAEVLPWPDLPRRTLEAGRAGAVVAAGSGAVLTTHEDAAGLALVAGLARASGDGRAVDAADLPARWAEGDHAAPEPIEGYHAALWMRADGFATAAADPLGLFPLYWADLGEVLLVGSSPEPFRRHPCFTARLDPAGLVGILLLNAQVGGRTLWRGVRRLAAGSAVVRGPEGRAREAAWHPVPVSRRWAGLSFAAQADLLESALEGAFARHTPSGVPHGLLLSGGLDSRFHAAWMTAQGTPVTALTLGRPDDLEVRCARGVAAALGIRQLVRETPGEQWPEMARWSAGWEHLAGGFSFVERWDAPARARLLPPRVALGHVFDNIVGPHTFTEPGPEDSRRFAGIFGHLTAWGFGPSVLRRLLRPEAFGTVLDDLLGEVEAGYDAGAGDEFGRVRAFYLLHRQRFLVGANLWPLSTLAGVALPVLDRRVIDLGLGMPEESVMRRSLEIEVLRRRHPLMLRLPLEQNRLETPPVDPRGLARLGWGFVRRARPLRVLRRAWLLRRGEIRYQRRTADLDRPPWRAVRRAAEPFRPLVAHLFRDEVLSSLLPPPDAPSGTRARIAAGTAVKNLLGLLLWAGAHRESL